MLQALATVSELWVHTADFWCQELWEWHKEGLQMCSGDILSLGDANTWPAEM